MKIVEWDMINGEVVARVPCDNLEECIATIEDMIRDAEKDGWDCEEYSDYWVCSKDEYTQHQLVIED